MFGHNALMGMIPGQYGGPPPPGYAQPLGGPNTQFPLNPYPPGGPVMQPGGGNAPPPQFLGPPVQMNDHRPYGDMPGMMQDFRNNLMNRNPPPGFPPMSHFGPQAAAPAPNTIQAQPQAMGLNPNYQFPTYRGG